jgi:CBS domain-containing protein
MPKVSEIMRKHIASVAPSASVTEVAQKMRDYETGAVAVCDNGKLRGIITERNIVLRVVANNRNPSKEQAASLVFADWPKIPPGADIAEAAKVMASHGVQTLPVVQNGKLLGILTLDDLIRETPALAVMVMTSKSEGKVNGNRA